MISGGCYPLVYIWTSHFRGYKIIYNSRAHQQAESDVECATICIENWAIELPHFQIGRWRCIWCMPFILALWRNQQEDLYEFKVQGPNLVGSSWLPVWWWRLDSGFIVFQNDKNGVKFFFFMVGCLWSTTVLTSGQFLGSKFTKVFCLSSLLQFQ